MTAARLLIADDDRIILATLAEDLSEQGYSVRTASNGEEALAACRQDAPDLAILDIRMPVMGGIDAARLIRAECDTATLFLSAYSDRDLVELAVAEGAQGYLVKPITIEKLTPAIDAAIARGRELREAKMAQSHMTQALQAKREVDIAVGLLLERFNLNREHAFEVLRRLARSRNRKLADIAGALVECSELFTDAQQISLELRGK